MKNKIERAIKELEHLHKHSENLVWYYCENKIKDKELYHAGKSQAYQIAINKLKEIIGIDWREENNDQNMGL